ncbi:MAG TPA: hypothetical protein VLA91_08850 [Acidimicrobiia bacterium]|nr:hypothetical protein [Acidimicrobiia bacterium]
MRRTTAWLIAGLMILVWACGGEGDGTGTTDVAAAETETDGTEAAESTETSEATEEEAPDNCSLITQEEATALAGYDLEVGEDSILGCGYLPPGSDVADIVVNAVLLEGDVASIAAEGFPNATDIIPVDVGEDTVAVTTPSGDTVASVITASGGRLVELAIVFLGIDPGDTGRIEEAATLAVTALDRWD